MPENPAKSDGANFKALFCRHYRIPESEFIITCYRRTLRRRAWLVWPCLVWFRRRELEADLELIERLGRCRDRDEISRHLPLFQLNETNLSLVRRRLGLRVSIRRITREAVQLYQSPR